MRTGLLLCLLLLFGDSLCSQSVYTFRYNFNSPQDSTTYHAFLLRNDDGTGLIRIRYSPGRGMEEVLVEAFADEQNPPDKNGDIDTSLLWIKTVSPSFLQANDKPVFNAPVFLFSYNPQTGFFDPSGVSTEATAANGMSPATRFSWKLQEAAGLERKLVGLFFSEDDDFYTNLFRQTTRGLSEREKKIRMHLLIVADTLDKRIGKSAVIDIQKVMETFGSISKYLGIKMLPTILYGKTYGKTAVQEALAKLRAATARTPNDIIIFYYSGHGFRLPEAPREFPNLKLKNFIVPRPPVFKTVRDSLTWVKKERDANISSKLNIEDIFRDIQKMGTRFNLVIGDCCNDDIFSVNVEGKRPSKTKGSGIEWDEENIRSLFLSTTPMSVLFTAATAGEKATSKNDYGGFFTDFFKRSLENHCSKLRVNVTWDLILRQVKAQTAAKARAEYCANPRIPANACKQNPVSDIRIGTR